MTDDNAGQARNAADSFDAVLKERAGEHPDVGVYLRMRERSRKTLARLWDPQTVSPEAMAWALRALGADDTEDAYRARANAVVDAITGRASEAAARAAEITLAERAALAWLREVTGGGPSAEVTERLHETAVRHAAGIGYGTPAVALIQAAVGVLTDAARAGGGA